MQRLHFFWFHTLVWGALLVWAARAFAVSPFWVVVVSVLGFSLPIMLYGFYSSTIQQIHRFSILSSQGWIYLLFSGRFIKFVVWFCWALISSFLMLLQFHTYAIIEWINFFFIVPLFIIVFSLIRLSRHEIKTYAATYVTLNWTNRTVPLLMLLLYIFAQVQFSEIPAYTSLETAVEAQQSLVADMNGSALISEMAQYLAFYGGLKVYALGQFGKDESRWALALWGTGSFMLFYNACLTLSCFLISLSEYRRIASPLSDVDHAPPLQPLGIAAIMAVMTFVVFFVYLPTFTSLEALSQQHKTELVEFRQNVETIVEQQVVAVEQIGDNFFKLGTQAELEDAKLAALRAVDANLRHLDTQAALAFDRVEANVDIFLDWYYSLTGEYTRIATLLVGDLENELTAKLEETLQQGKPFKEYELALQDALIQYDQAQAAYQQLAQQTLANNKIVVDDSVKTRFEVVRTQSLQEVFNPPHHQDMIALQQRMSAASGVGAVTGLITALVIKKIVAKIIAKSTLKLAAKTLSKVILSKAVGGAGGAAAGATTGAAIGSLVLPGGGTVAGGVIGGIIGGLVVGVSVDKLLIELEESISREQFKSEILASIREARQEFTRNLSK